MSETVLLLPYINLFAYYRDNLEGFCAKRPQIIWKGPSSRKHGSFYKEGVYGSAAVLSAFLRKSLKMAHRVCEPE